VLQTLILILVQEFKADVPPYQKEKMIFGGGLERFTGNM
jgi:hypothetical protein